MIRIETLLDKVGSDASPRMMGNGFVCWLVYTQALPSSFCQALAEMGGWVMAEDANQSVWFFPSIEVLQGLARLYNWARLQPMATSITVLEAGLVVDAHLGTSLKVKQELCGLTTDFAKRLNVRVSPRVRELGKALAGVIFKQVQNPDGMGGEWFELESSEQVVVAGSLYWLWVIRPQGDRQDKGFLKGWRSHFDRLENLFSQHKVSFLHAENQALVLRITSQRNMARFTADLLAILQDKQTTPWPCQYVALNTGEYTFAIDLPGRIRNILDTLETNALHLPLATVFQLADARIVPVESRLSQHSMRLTDLFQIRLVAGGEVRHGRVNVFLPRCLVSGAESPCFYCGLRSHLPGACPSRRLKSGNVQVTDTARFARMDMETLPTVMTRLEQQLAPDVVKGASVLLGEKDDLGVVLGVVFEISRICQLRMMAMVWRAKGKDWPRGIESLRPQTDQALWDALESLQAGNVERAQDRAEQFMLNAPKNYQPRVLLGFIAVECGELKRAAGYWADAEGLAYTSLQRSYIMLLQGRLREVLGDFPEAIRMYGRALNESSGFYIARYRQGVCLAKSGRIHEAMALFRELIRGDADFFSMVLLDPEVEGCRSHLLSDLWEIWHDGRVKAAEVLGSVEYLPDLLAKWLPEDHPAYHAFQQRIQELTSLVGVNNYVSMAKLLNGTIAIKADIQHRVKKDIEELTAKRKTIVEQLRVIQREASWFPLPSLLGSFRGLFNSCGEQLNVISHLDMYVPDKFRQAHEAMREAEVTLVKLEKKLLVLQGVRNGILFLLLSGKYLLIFELVALVLSGCVSALVYFVVPNQTIFGMDLRDDRWLVLNLSLIFFTFLAVCLTAIRASARFDAYKNEVLDKEE